MKKVLSLKSKYIPILVLLLLGWCNSIHATQHDIVMRIIDKSPAHGGKTLAPPRPWCITQDDYILTIPKSEVDYTLVLLDENGIEVYSTYLPVGSTQVFLPSTLFGEYELRLIPSSASYYYRGFLLLE